MSLTSVSLQPAQSAGADADGVVAILEEYICHPPLARPELQTCNGAVRRLVPLQIASYRTK